jgi:microcystin degradation protein MlrC
MRIAVGGFQHESHSFPPLQRPAGLVEALRPTSVPSAGAIAAAEEAGAEIAPLVWCFANPAGPVAAEAFERVAAMMVAALSNAMEAGR